MLPPVSMESSTEKKALYSSVAVTPAPVQALTQRSIVPSFASVVDQARTFYLALVYGHIFYYLSNHMHYFNE
jgi:hypothetical protein